MTTKGVIGYYECTGNRNIYIVCGTAANGVDFEQNELVIVMP